MFTSIDGGFQFAIQGLFTMDLSWLFCFCTLSASNIVLFAVKLGKKIKDKRNKDE